jgi:ATP-dependent Clp protease ATP-binding subunit ClpB
VNFKNTIIIMTSNVGSQIIQESYEKEDVNHEAVKAEVFDTLRRTLRPEFLNRIDETIMFTPLTRGEIKEIVVLQLARLKERLLNADINMAFTPDSIAYLAEEGFDPQFGARPVKRVIQKEVLNELSRWILAGKVDKSKKVVLDVINGQIIFRKEIEEDQLIEA